MRKESITGQNAELFGNAICNELGFKKKFVGDRSSYYNFMGVKAESEGELCVPEYVISGAKCTCPTPQSCSIENCDFRNYRIDGGTCLKGVSDVFVHCEAPLTPVVGSWSSWNSIGYCQNRDYFQQKFRLCGGKNAFCSGPWLELVPCGQCLNDIRPNNNYNYEYEHEYNYSYDYSNRTKKVATYNDPICECSLTTVNRLPKRQEYSLRDLVGPTYWKSTKLL